MYQNHEFHNTVESRYLELEATSQGVVLCPCITVILPWTCLGYYIPGLQLLYGKLRASDEKMRGVWEGRTLTTLLPRPPCSRSPASDHLVFSFAAVFFRYHQLTAWNRLGYIERTESRTNFANLLDV